MNRSQPKLYRQLKRKWLSTARYLLACVKYFYLDKGKLWSGTLGGCSLNFFHKLLCIPLFSKVVSLGTRENLDLFLPYINILLSKLSWSLWENLDLGHVYRPHCIQSVLTTSVKILTYRPLARLIRATGKCSSIKSLYLFRSF